MAEKNVVILGDPGNHGGTVIAANQDFIYISGKAVKPIAVEGGKISDHVIGQVLHSNNKLIASQDFIKINDKFVIIDGDSVSCGEKVNATSQDFIKIKV